MTARKRKNAWSLSLVFSLCVTRSLTFKNGVLKEGNAEIMRRENPDRNFSRAVKSLPLMAY